jgi:hypothetical protein
MNEVRPIRPAEEEPPTPPTLELALVTILQSEPEIAAWLAGDEDDDPPQAA